MSHTIKYKNAHIHISNFQGHEEILVQWSDGTLLFVSSVRSAKIRITRGLKQ